MAITMPLAPEILDLKQRRLFELQKRAALLGTMVPPETAMEIQDLEREIAAATPATVAESHPILLSMIMETRADMRRILWCFVPVIIGSTASLAIGIIVFVLLMQGLHP